MHTDAFNITRKFTCKDIHQIVYNNNKNIESRLEKFIKEIKKISAALAKALGAVKL